MNPAHRLRRVQLCSRWSGLGESCRRGIGVGFFGLTRKLLLRKEGGADTLLVTLYPCVLQLDEHQHWAANRGKLSDAPDTIMPTRIARPARASPSCHSDRTCSVAALSRLDRLRGLSRRVRELSRAHSRRTWEFGCHPNRARMNQVLRTRSGPLGPGTPI